MKFFMKFYEILDVENLTRYPVNLRIFHNYENVYLSLRKELIFPRL